MSRNFTLRFSLPLVAFIAVFASVLHASVARAAVDDFAIREWHMQDGLPTDQITRINQDADGYLWVGTTSGMMRFDGAHFTEYPLTPEKGSYTRVTTSNSVHGVIAAPFARRGLVKMEDVVFRPWLPEHFEGRVVSALFSETTGALWIACDDGTVARYEGGKLRIFNSEDGIPRARTRTFASDGNGSVWIASDGFVAHYQEGELVPFAEDFGGSELRIGSSETGGPWLVTRDRLLRLDGDRAVELARLPPLMGAHYVQALEEDRNGVLWLGTRSQGLHILVGGGIQQIPTSYEDIFSLCEDRDGNMWIGTNGGGLYRASRKTFRLYDKSAGLLDNFTHTVAEDAQGDIWFANRDGGVARVRDGIVDVLAKRPGWPQMSAVSVFRLPGGKMGVTGGAAGIFELSDDPARPAKKIEGFPPGQGVRVTFTARNGDVWFALDSTQMGRLRGGSLKTFGVAEGFDGRQVRGIAEDSHGAILLGTSDGKLFRGEKDRFERISTGEIPTGAIQTIRIEDGDEIWLGTVESGIVVLRGDKIRRCTERNGLPDSNITQIIPDGYGYLWFGSTRGIFRLSRKELVDCLDGKIPRVSPIIIGHDEGLKSISTQGIYQPAALRSKDGKLWFATRRGVVAIDPRVQLDLPRPPLVKIEEVRCDDQPVSLAGNFRVASNVRKLEIRFGVLNLSAPDRVHAKYRLDGFDHDWVVAPANRVAAYPRLTPGNYLFHVVASGGDGAVNEAGDTLHLTVEPRWWQTWWLQVGAGLFAMVVVGLVVRGWSHRPLRDKLGKLERERAIEHERRRIAQNIHDDLGASLTRISLLTQHARHENASAAGYFDEIHQTATNITRAMDEIVWVVNPNYDHLESLAAYIGDFAQKFLALAGIRCRLDIPPELPPIPVTSQVRHHLFLCCKEALNNVVKHAHADEVVLSIHSSDQQFVITIRDNGNGADFASINTSTNGRQPARVVAGLGLDGMKQRMAAINGRFEVAVPRGGGTTVTLTMLFAVEKR